jgi:hypothetical protein
LAEFEQHIRRGANCPIRDSAGDLSKFSSRPRLSSAGAAIAFIAGMDIGKLIITSATQLDPKLQKRLASMKEELRKLRFEREKLEIEEKRGGSARPPSHELNDASVRGKKADLGKFFPMYNRSRKFAK